MDSKIDMFKEETLKSANNLLKRIEEHGSGPPAGAPLIIFTDEIEALRTLIKFHS